MKGRHVPLRMCVICRKLRPREELFRLVKSKDRPELVADPGGRLAGKGVYFCRSRECLDRLLREKRFRRIFLGKIEDRALQWMLSETGLAR
jgi:predicted RNA-binding protein YlxR (DUF448 family)